MPKRQHRYQIRDFIDMQSGGSPRNLFVFAVVTILVIFFACRASLAAGPPAFIKASLGKPEKIWTGQRVNMEITLYTTTSFSGTTRFNLPKVSGMLIMENEDRPLLGTETISGVSYISKRHEINLFPLRSGTLTIPPFEVEFGFRGEDGKVVRRSFRTEELKFSVLKIPGADPGKPVITTTDLQIKDQWHPEPGKAKVGDAFTRTVILTAENIPGMAFPPFEWNKIDGLGLYRKQPQVNDRMERGAFIGQRIETVTYVCEQEGDFSIPGMALSWWNPKSETLREVPLKEVNIKVAANPILKTQGQPGMDQQSLASFSWKLAGIALLVLVVLLLGILWFFRFKERQSSSVELSEAVLFKAFHRAANSGDAAKTMQALMRWLDHSGLTGAFGRLDILVSKAGDADLDQQVQALEADLFSAVEEASSAGSWSTDGLYRAVKRARRKLGRNETHLRIGLDRLPDLNP